MSTVSIFLNFGKPDNAFAAPPTKNNVWYVGAGKQFSNVTNALDPLKNPKLVNGDTILVDPGTYTESRFIVTKNLTIKKSQAVRPIILGPITVSGIGASKSVIDGFEVQTTGIGITLLSTSNVKINDCVAKNGNTDGNIGLKLEWANSINITNCDFSNNVGGIDLFQSDGNVIERCIVNNCDGNKGNIHLWADSDNNIISYCKVNDSATYGIWLNITDNNEVSNNVLTKNGNNIMITGSATSILGSYGNNNLLYKNFLNNDSTTWNAVDSGTNNRWYSPGPMPYTYNGGSFTNYNGNWWSDYQLPVATDINNDGIADSPYLFNNNVDNYPMIYTDDKAPISTITFDGTKGSAPWYISSVTATIAATDNTGGTGVASIWYSIDGSPWVSVDVSSMANPAVQLPTIDKEGTTAIQYYAKDKLGIQEAIRSAGVKIDKSAPVTECILAPAAGSSYVEAWDPRGWNTTDVTVTLTGTDAFSGVASTQYSTDGGATWGTYSQPFTITYEGTTKLLYNSTDSAGNKEDAKPRDITIYKPHLKLTADPGSILKGGVDTSTITAQLTMHDENYEKAGVGITFESIASVSPTTGTTDATGKATTILTSPASSGSVTVTAISTITGSEEATVSVSVIDWGTISGMVLDWNGDGVPLATIVLNRCVYTPGATPGTGTWSATNDVVSVQPANPQETLAGGTVPVGMYAFYKVWPGMYMVSAWKGSAGAYALVEVTDGSVTANIVFKDYDYVPGPFIVPTVNAWPSTGISFPEGQGSIAGVIIDSDGNGLIIGVQATSSTGQAYTTSTNDGSSAVIGSYEFHDLPAGTYTVTCVGGDGKATVVVDSGTETASMVNVALNGMGALAGMVNGQKGEGIAGAVVTLTDKNGVTHTAITGDGTNAAAGTFAIDGIAPGDYKYKVSAEAYGFEYYGTVLIAGGETSTANVLIPYSYTPPAKSTIGVRYKFVSQREDIDCQVWLLRKDKFDSTCTVHYTMYVYGDSAATLSDFNKISYGTVTFNSGERRKAIWVHVIDDKLTEGNEYFYVKLIDVANAYLGDTVTRCEIRDNELLRRG